MQPIPLANVIGPIPDAALGVFITMAALIYAIRRWRRNVKQQNIAKERERMNSPSPSYQTPNALSVREVTTEIHAMLADIEETSRRAAAQIENRCVKLETLLTEADSKIKRLESLLQQNSLPPRTEESTKIAAQTLSQLRHERGAPAPTQDPAYSPIYNLADQGKSPREIAQELNRQPGEIELILALRSR